VGRAFSRVLPDAVVALVTLVLTWPMWTHAGYGLARDLAFTPREPWNRDAIGMGSSLPRAVPLDGVLAAATSVVDGAVVFRIAVAGVLLLAGLGSHRLLGSLLPDAPTSARCLAALVAVWNPFVVERLALGQWALLAAYAALFWWLPALRHRAWPALLAWTWLGSLTPSGGLALVLLAAAVGLVALFRRTSRRAAGVALAIACLGQLPWVLAGVLGATAATSDPAGVAAFASRAERPGGIWATLLGTGGVWSPFEVPGTLTSWPGHLLTVLALAALAAGGLAIWRREPALVVAAAAGLLLAGAAQLPGGADALRWAVSHVPGGGLLRDGQKWLLPYAALVVVAAGAASARMSRALRARDQDPARLLAAALTLLPVALVPDAAATTWAALRPVTYPADLARAVSTLDRAPDSTGDAVTLPWAAYRRFSWGQPVSAADPLPRWTTHRTVVSDTLPTVDGPVAGEDPRARQIATALAGTGPPGPALAPLGVGWVLVYADQPGAEGLDRTGLDAVVDGPDVTLYRVSDAVNLTRSGPGTPAVVVVAAADALWGVAWLMALALAAAWRRRRGRPAADASPGLDTPR
jgi:hypothetical protein